MEALSRWVLTFLLNSLWQVAMITAAAALADLWLRQVPARYRHALWAIALAAAVVLPLASLRTVVVAGSEHGRALSPVQTTVEASARLPAPVKLPVVRGEVRPFGAAITGMLLARRQRAITFPRAVMRAVLPIYLLFFAFMVLRFGRAWLRTREVRRLAASDPLPQHVRSILEVCWRTISDQRRYGHAPAPSILWSSRVPGPVTLGARRATIILPVNLLREEAQDDLMAVLAHEMAHVCRRDYLWNFVYELVSLPVAFHPLTLLVKRRLGETRELACDELATRVLTPALYARSLVRMAHDISRFASPATLGPDYTLGVFDAGILEERVMRLMKRRAGARLARLSLFFGVLVMATLCFVGLRFPVGVTQAEERNPSAASQGTLATDQVLAPFAGTWRGELNGKTFALLKLGLDNHQVAGTISTGEINLDASGNVEEVTAEAQTAVPIFDSKVDTGKLYFKQKDGDSTLNYAMEVDRAERAQLQILTSGGISLQPFKLVKESETVPAGSTGGLTEQRVESKGAQYAVAGGIPGGVSGGVAGGVRKGVSGRSSGSPRPQDESDNKTGSLSGIVVDPSGARIPQAEVLLASRDSDFRKSIESDDTGGFSFDDVLAGRYTLEVISKGMGGTFRKFTFKPGGAAPFFPFVLQPGEVMESAIVTASAPPGLAAGSTAVAGAGPRRIRVGGNVEAAKLIEQPPLVYPESARSAGLQGVVILQAAISPRGVPEDLKVISSPGDDLSKAALDAVKHWRYQPTLLNGEPIEVVTTITVDFRLQD